MFYPGLVGPHMLLTRLLITFSFRSFTGNLQLFPIFASITQFYDEIILHKPIAGLFD